MLPSRSQIIAATGDVPGATNGGTSVVMVTPAAALATVVVRSNGATGTIIATLQAGASGSSVPFGPFHFDGQLHLTITGAGASVNVLT